MRENKQNSESDKKEETIESTPASNEVKSEENTEAAGITTPAEKTEATAPAMEETVDSEDIQEEAAEESKADTSSDTAADSIERYKF